MEGTVLANMRTDIGLIREAKASGRFVRIDRQSKWGNPFRIGMDGTRDEVIDKYEVYIRSKPELMSAIEELRGKVLGCWCRPQPCHGRVLLKLLWETIPNPLKGLKLSLFPIGKEH